MTSVCMYCDEAILPNDAADTNTAGQPFHMDCLARAALGSLAHIQKRCSCYIPGSTEGDPPGMTKRQAARAAVEAARLRNYSDVLNIDGHCPLCGCDDFYRGPRGGAACNIMCSRCGAKYWYCPPFMPSRIYSQPDDVYDLSKTEKLPRG